MRRISFVCSCRTARGVEGKKRRISFVCKAEQPEEVKERREGYHSCVKQNSQRR